MDFPTWYDGKNINETLFCEEFLAQHPMVSVNDTFFTKNGRITDENALKKEIYDRIKPYVTGGIARKITGILDVLRVECYCHGLPLYQDRIHVANGTPFLDGRFSESFCSYLKQNEHTYNLEYTNKVHVGNGRFVRGFMGIEVLQRGYEIL